MTKLYYPTAFSLWETEERAAVARVINSDRFTQGAEVRAFERELAAFHGRRHAVMCNSGSSANLLAVEALFLRSDRPLVAGDLAFVPALAWATTYAPLVQRGMRLRLIDCDDTWNASPTHCEASGRIVPREVPPRLVVAVPVLGNPAHLHSWERLASECGAYLIEDNCESIGARTEHGRLTGTFGIASTLSFYWSHQISGIEGGAVLTDDDELAYHCRLLLDHGLASRPGPERSPSFGYDFRLFGYNLRPLEMHAAVAHAQLRKLDRFVEARCRNLSDFVELVAEHGVPIDMPHLVGSCSPFGIQFTVPTAELRDLLATALAESGVDCRPPTGGSFSRHRYGRAWRDQPTPNADRIHDTGMFIGNAPFPIVRNIERAMSVVRGIL